MAAVNKQIIFDIGNKEPTTAVVRYQPLLTNTQQTKSKRID